MKWIFFFVCLLQGIEATEINTGTLIVTYETDQDGYCLDRLRFWLVNEKQERNLYPKQEEFVDNNLSCTERERTVAIPHLAPGKYSLQFIVPNRDNMFEIPTPKELEITQGSVVKVEQKIKKLYEEIDFVDVPAGEAIFGDPFNDNKQNERPAKKMMIPLFAIGRYEVTNEQFSHWLNRAIKTGSIVLDKQKNGLILNKAGKPICKTSVADPQAQITFQKTAEGIVKFSAAPGKEDYPVILVTWYGAEAFCADHNCRLPSEAEWEKAAGMSLPVAGEPLKRFRFGFGRDAIDPTWANYRYRETPLHGDKVLTTPVGFYDGIEAIDGKNTHDAKSPVGAYDMSGNVWEWVSSWDDLDSAAKNKVLKGGCYDSTADGVRVSERLPAPPDYSDIYSGFRVAKDVK